MTRLSHAALHAQAQANPLTKRIRELNDLARTAMGVCSKVYMSHGVAALPAEDRSRLRELVERFDAFTYDNDPHGEGDFGAVEHHGVRYFWKIDYYAKGSDCYGSEDPSDPKQTDRVLTIMRADEY